MLNYLNVNLKNDIDFINFPEHYISILKKIVLSTLKSENINKYLINFVIINDVEIKKLNTRYKNNKHITDVISFLLIPKFFIGDIYISEKHSKSQAKKYCNTWEKELAYLVIHGTLHLCGYTDYDVINRKKMFEKQDCIFKNFFCN
ncbi:MAG: rRNA maturation RNase YbeY [Endomicrobium sp.]|jgi:probable rRNA maturation factor|nr:rRNA maturation RNase YbeY [Endomicrobium sp.]